MAFSCLILKKWIGSKYVNSSFHKPYLRRGRSEMQTAVDISWPSLNLGEGVSTLEPPLMGVDQCWLWGSGGTCTPWPFLAEFLPLEIGGKSFAFNPFPVGPENAHQWQLLLKCFPKIYSPNLTPKVHALKLITWKNNITYWSSYTFLLP